MGGDASFSLHSNLKMISTSEEKIVLDNSTKVLKRDLSQR